MTAALTPNVSPRRLLGAELRHWRQTRGLSTAQLARSVYVSRELLQKVETAHRNAGQDLIAACDTALEAGGALVRLLDFAVHQAHGHARTAQTEPEAMPPDDPPIAVPMTILITVTADVLPSTGFDGALRGPQPLVAEAASTRDARIYQFPKSRRSRLSR